MADTFRFDLTIRNGLVITEDEGARIADIGVRDGCITVIAAAGTLQPSDTDIDASGLVVAPGGVDSHCHIEQRTSTGLTPCDDFYTASVSALCGGTTTFIPFACQHKGQRIADAVEEYRACAKKAACDYAVHIIVSDPAQPCAIEDLRACIASGYTSVKVYMTYDALKLNDMQMLDVLALCRAEGAMLMVHAESDGMVRWITSRLLQAELTAPLYHAGARPALAEREATHRALTFAEYVGTPMLIVHVSGSEATNEIARAQCRHNADTAECRGKAETDAKTSLPVFGETCPQYLTLTMDKLKGHSHGHGHSHDHDHSDTETQEALARARAHGEWEGAKYLCSPPLRTPKDVDALWAALRENVLQIVSSDHSAYNFAPPTAAGANPASKLMHGVTTADSEGEGVRHKFNFSSVPMGLPGLETRLPLLFSEGVQRGRINLETFAAVTATNPAKLYGLYPRKGVIRVGADADLALFDPAARWKLTHSTLHDELDYSPYEGMDLRGALLVTILRGRVVFQRSGGDDRGEVHAGRGTGEWLPCAAPNLLGRGQAHTFPCKDDVVLEKASRL